MSYKQEKSIEFFRDFDVYSLTIDQHAALVSVLNHALDRIGSAKDREASENIVERDIFRHRYGRLLRKAEQTVILRGKKSTSGDAPQTPPTPCSNIEPNNKNDEAKWAEIETDKAKWPEAVKYLQSYLTPLRNYFTHYLHTDIEFKKIKNDKIFQVFLNSLTQEAFDIWNKDHIAWLDNPDQADKDLSHAITDFSWSAWKKNLEVYEKRNSEAPFSMCSLLLFISIFAAKDVMYKFLNKLHIFKQNDRDTPQDVLFKTSARELFTALSLPARFDAQSAVDKNIIAAWTVLDNFAHRLGKRTHYKKYAGQIAQSPLTDDCMSKSFNQHFYIRMLVNIIEASEILPNMAIARTYEGRPSFELPDANQREVYIRHNAVAIQWSFSQNPIKWYGQLSMNALISILCAWLHSENPKNIQSLLFKELTKVAQYLKKEDFPSIDTAISQAFPQFFIQESPAAEPDKEQASAALYSRIEALEGRYFAQDMPPHKQIIGILWWINRLLPEGNKIHKEAYSNALIYAPSNTMAMFHDCLPKLDALTTGEDKDILTNLYGKIKTATNLSVAFNEARINFKNTLARVFSTTHQPYKLQQNATLKKIERLAKLVGLRRVKPKTTSQKEAWKLFQNRFKNAASLPAWYIWELLVLQAEPQKGSQGNIPLGAFLNKYSSDTNSGDKSVDKTLDRKYYITPKHAKKYALKLREYEEYTLKPNPANPVPKPNPEEHAFKIRNCDRLLLHLAEKLLRNPSGTAFSLKLNDDFTYEVHSHIGAYTLIIPHTQARRTYVSRHADRLKNVIEHYWMDKDIREIYFACPPETPDQTKPERAENAAPRDFLEAESDMEQERFIMIKAVLLWERDITKQHIADPIQACLQAKNGKYLGFHAMLAAGGYNNDPNAAQYNDFRKWALHRTPEKAFSQAQGELGNRFSKIKKDILERRKEAKKKAVRSKFQKMP